MTDADDFARKVRETRDASDLPVEDGLSDQDVRRANAIVWLHNNVDDIADAFLRQHEECKRLESWRQEALALEDTWDVQAIGKLIKAPLGSDIRANIQPYIERLKARNKRLRSALHELVATVRGECRWLLDEDSGGSAALDIEIDELLSAPNEGGE